MTYQQDYLCNNCQAIYTKNVRKQKILSDNKGRVQHLTLTIKKHFIRNEVRISFTPNPTQKIIKTKTQVSITIRPAIIYNVELLGHRETICLWNWALRNENVKMDEWAFHKQWKSINVLVIIGNSSSWQGSRKASSNLGKNSDRRYDKWGDSVYGPRIKWEKLTQAAYPS